MRCTIHAWGVLLATFSLTQPGWAQDAKDSSTKEVALRIEPAAVTLTGPHAVQRLLVTGRDGAMQIDRTRSAVYSSSDPNVATITADGLVRPAGNGTAEIRATVAGQTTTAKVAVKDFGSEAPVSFRNQIVPIFTRLGCNAGGCHGKSVGQGGFRLTLFGFDADQDYDAVVKDSRGRRVFPASPANSLLLLKATGSMAHGGGKRLRTESESYRLMMRWLNQGMSPGCSDDPTVVRIDCTPPSRLLGLEADQQLLVTATYSDGSQRDVTDEAQFRSNQEHVAAVDTAGLVHTFRHTGGAVVMARYMGHVAVCSVVVPLTDRPAIEGTPLPPRRNYVDDFIQARWQLLKIGPSANADDATFLRRAFLDTIGTLPTPDEVRAFLADPDPNKREQWVDRILARPEYADFWAGIWGDLLRNKRRGGDESIHGTFTFHAWLRQAFAQNMPYDRFVRAIVAAQGPSSSNPPVLWYREVRGPGLPNDTAQLFLGTRLNCAQCHHHPYEKWSQEDYQRFQAFFSRIAFKNGTQPGEQALYLRSEGQPARRTKGGKTGGENLTPRPLDGPEIVVEDDEDPRQKLVDWMIAPENPFFARAIANRLWAHFMGRGLVEPVDDMRVTNPPSHPELLDALAKDLVKNKYDLKRLMRALLLSTTYQLASDLGPGNAHDRQNYARAYPRRLPAEVLLDAVSQVTGVPERFTGLPDGTRAIELPDEMVSSYFLDVFGRSRRDSPCECERSGVGNLAQALHLLNAADLHKKLGTGRLARLLQQDKPNEAILDELYLTAFARLPSADERKTALAYIARQEERLAALEDVLWVLLNTKEFMFNH